MTDELRSINCTACGAGLNVFGGGRVTAHVCGYCGAAMDRTDSYKVLRRFIKTERPTSPFSIGDEGEIEGVSYRIIGTLGMVERYGAYEWRWAEHQIFSPTHGYAWLSVENGNAIFSRRSRYPSNPTWVSRRKIDTSDTRPIIWHRGKRCPYYESGNNQIDYIEGEFSWMPEHGKRRFYASFLADDRMVTLSGHAKETEVMVSRYPDQERLFKSFGRTPPNHPETHPLRPFYERPHGVFRQTIGLMGLVVLLFAAMFLGTSRDVGHLGPAPLHNLPIEWEVGFNKPGQLAEITFETDTHNSWAWYGITVTDPNDEVVFTTNAEMGYYSGRDWSEGSNIDRIRFHYDVAGVYTIEIEEVETGVDWQGGHKATYIRAFAREGVWASIWMIWAGIVFIVLAGWRFARGWLWHKARWRGSDWEDE